MNTPVEDANERMMQRYRKAIIIESNEQGYWITLDGVNYHNDPDKLAEAVRLMPLDALSSTELRAVINRAEAILTNRPEKEERCQPSNATTT